MWMWNHFILCTSAVLLNYYSATKAWENNNSLISDTMCGANSTCNSGTAATGPLISGDLKYRQCACDFDCKEYGDCCLDSVHYDSKEQTVDSASKYECADISYANMSIYMVKSCPSDQIQEWKIKCSFSQSFKQTADLIDMAPVTDLDTDITYGNVYCALCHNATSLLSWDAKFGCQEVFDEAGVPVDISNLTSNFRFDEGFSKWTADFDLKFAVECVCYFYPPLISKDKVRNCVTVKQKCPQLYVTAATDDVGRRCESHTSIVYYASTGYRNRYCAICNGIPESELTCYKKPPKKSRERRHDGDFAILFNIEETNVSPKKKTSQRYDSCSPSEFYDPFAKMCRHVVTDGKPRNISSSIKVYVMSGDNMKHLAACKRTVLPVSDFTYTEEGIYLSRYEKTLFKNEFLRTRSGVEICEISLTEKISSYFVLVSIIGIGISIACLLIHLSVFLFVKELHNLFGKSLASFCLALLLSYGSFTAGKYVESWTSICEATGGTTYYFFMSTFCWMFVISFDVWRMIQSSAKLKVVSGGKSSRFFVYSAICWIFPALCATATFILDYWHWATPEYLAELRPMFRKGKCWFGQRKSLIAFFLFPLTLILSANAVMFFHVILSICKAKVSSESNTRGNQNRDIKMYFRLAILMGFTWFTGLLAATTNDIFAQLAFVLLNTVQGLFIFLAFTINKRVMNKIRKRRGDSSAQVSLRSLVRTSSNSMKSTSNNCEASETELTSVANNRGVMVE